MPSPAPSPSRLLVTGGRGRLASLIADHFRGSSREAVLYSRGAGTGFRAIAELTGAGLPRATDTLLHLAWSTLPATAEQATRAAEQPDLSLLRDLLDACARAPGPARPHFVFFSSGGAVYGNAPGRPSVEDDACQPIGRYGRGKLAAEQLVADAARLGLPCTILRISNPYGYPVPAARVQGIIPHAIRCALEDRPLTLWGDGQARKDFLHYTDFLSALDTVVARRLTGTYNVCAGESHSVHEIIALVEKHTGRKIRTNRTEAPAWDVQDSRLDHGRLTAATGWRPQIGLDEGVRRAVAGHRA